MKIIWREFAKFDGPTREKTYNLRPGDELRLTNPDDEHPTLRLLCSADGLVVEAFSCKWVPTADDLLRRLG